MLCSAHTNAGALIPTLFTAVLASVCLQTYSKDEAGLVARRYTTHLAVLALTATQRLGFGGTALSTSLVFL